MARLELFGIKRKAERKIEIDKDLIIIGRNENCDIILGHGFISDQHCYVFRSGKGYFLGDLYSTHGTYHEGKKIADLREIDDQIYEPFINAVLDNLKEVSIGKREELRSHEKVLKGRELLVQALRQDGMKEYMTQNGLVVELLEGDEFIVSPFSLRFSRGEGLIRKLLSSFKKEFHLV